MKRQLALLAPLALVACGKTQTSDTTTTGARQTATPAAVTAMPATTVKATETATTTSGAPAVTFKDVGLATPESVLYDEATDTYLVSIVNGKPTDADNNGFIAQLSPDGAVKTLKWIESGKNNVKLDAPKGLAFSGDQLYVADLDTVRIFDRKTGAPKGAVKVPGATFLNDLATGPDGKIYASDSGLKAGAGGNFEPTGTDAVYALDKDKKLTTIAKNKDLGRPNGLYVAPDKVWVVTFGTGELYALDTKGKKSDAQKLPKGSLDGIVALPGGDLLVSSWDAQSVYRGRAGDADFKAVVENVKSPADIGYDTKRSRVLVPLFQADIVEAFDVK